MKLFYEGTMVIPSENTGFLGDMNDTELSLPDLLVDFLVGNQLLKRLAYLQRSLDPLDIEGLNHRIKQEKELDLLHTNDEELLSKLGGEITLKEYQDFVNTYLEHDSSINLEKATLRELIIAYLLSASFKDCSMIITINQRPSTTTSEKDRGAEQVKESEKKPKKDINAFLVDVDVKSITRLRRYAKLDRDLVDSFERFCKEGGGELGICREGDGC